MHQRVDHVAAVPVLADPGHSDYDGCASTDATEHERNDNEIGCSFDQGLSSASGQVLITFSATEVKQTPDMRGATEHLQDQHANPVEEDDSGRLG